MIEDSVRDEYFELLRFASVGADAACLRDCIACASWLRRWLGKLGFESELVYPEADKRGMPSPPVVIAERRGVEGAPVVLVYGHYDVQPPDPVESWRTPPFEPTVIDGRVYCRGAQDDKGQLFALLCGLRDLIGSGAGLGTVKLVLDGQEESGSRSLMALAPTLRRRLSADVLLVCDTSAAAGLRPAIVAGLRGIAHFTVRLDGPTRDLHSGEFGGVSPNPAQAIAELVASLHHADGSVAVPGFRDGIEPPGEEECRLAALSTPDEEAMSAEIGCAAVGGEAGKPVWQRLGFEPTIEINGIHAGYAGAGVKTVIPSTAFAKISLRLVPGQIPQAAGEAVRRYLVDRCPRGMRISFEGFDSGSAGFRLPISSPLFRLAEDVLKGIDPRGPLFLWDGASIPVIGAIREVSGASPLLVGWGQNDDCIHSPNESYSFVQFELARRWSRDMFSALFA